jgi:hypothetical protein
MIMDALYDLFAQKNLTYSARHFSTRWLNRASNYLCLNRDAEASAELVVHLARQVWTEGHRIMALKLLARTTLELWREFR